MKKEKSKEFEEVKGKVREFTTKESCAKGGKAAAEVVKKKNAMKAALQRIMEMKANSQDSEKIRAKFPELASSEIDGFIEVSVMMRQHARSNPAATAKLIEMMGGSEEVEKDTSTQIIVSDEKSKKAFEAIINSVKK